MIGPRVRNALRTFLARVGDKHVQGRAIAILGQVLLKSMSVLCFLVWQSYVPQRPASMKSESAASNLPIIDTSSAIMCVESHDLHDSDVVSYDEDWDISEED